MKQILCGLLLTAGAAFAEDTICSVTVAKALPSDKSLELRLAVRDGKIVGAIGRPVKYSRSPAVIDSSGVQLADGKLTGELKYQILSDGYLPATNGVCALNGLAVQSAPPPDAGTLARLVLECENAINHGGKDKPQSRRMQIVLAVREGPVFGAKAIPPGSLTDVACAPFVKSCAVTLTDGELGGTLEISVQPQDTGKSPVNYAYALTGRVIGDLATGTLALQRDGKPSGPVGTFVGAVRWGAAPAAGEGLYRLTIRDALGIGKFMDVYLTATGGKLVHGFATTPNFNNATHVVEVGKLALDGQRLSGPLTVTVQPDPWIPADGKPIACAYQVDATLRDSEITGTADKFVVEGSLTDKPQLGKLTNATLKLENGLHGKSDWHARAFVSCEIKDGRVTGGRISNNHTKLDGVVTGGDLKFDGERLVGKVSATVKQGDGGQEGQYEFTVHVLMVGTVGAGTFDSQLAGKTKSGRLWAAVRAE